MTLGYGMLNMGIPYPKMEIGLFLILERAMLCQQERFIKLFQQRHNMATCTFVNIDLMRLIYMILSYMQTLSPLLAMGCGLVIIEKLKAQQLSCVIFHLQHLYLRQKCTCKKLS